MTARARSRSDEDGRIESAARALFANGEAAAAVDFLRDRGVLLARHDHGAAPASLPCLCVECLDPERDEAASGGVVYVRDFVVTQYRVLFYWSPKELIEHAKQVRASMRSELRRHLRAGAITPKRKKPINPFTGKPVP